MYSCKILELKDQELKLRQKTWPSSAINDEHIIKNVDLGSFFLCM